MELVDCHTHSHYSDGSNTPGEMVARARELGISTICCTDHLTLPHEIDPICEVSVAQNDLPNLARDVLQAREDNPGIDVVFGFECDYYEGCEANVARWSAGATFRLGSVHLVEGRWIDDLGDLSYWDEHTTEHVWQRYFETWERACASGCGFDTMAHPDLVSLLGRFPSEGLRASLYDHAAQAAAAAQVRVEVNTAGLVKPVGRIYPAFELLECFCRAGVPITVGSDAHTVARVGEGIVRAYELARQAGYTRVEVPCASGSWRSIAI